MNDVNTRIEALEKKIQEITLENETLKTIIREAPIPLFVIGRDHKITHFNRACEELTGFSAGNMVGTDNQWKAFYAEKRPVMADLIIEEPSNERIEALYGVKYHRQLFEKGRYAASDYFPDLGHGGKWLFFTAAPVRDRQDRVIGAVETLQDVTVEKNAETATRELNRRYRMILEFIPYPIVVYDRNGLVSYVNPAFTHTFGWRLEELSGKTVPFVPDYLEKETHAMLGKFIENRALSRYETQRLTKDGRLLDVVLWAASYTRKQQTNTENVVILRDITEEKRLAANNKTILRITRALPEYPELGELMNYITKEIKEILQTEGALVLIYDEIKDEFFFLGASYDDTDTEKRVKEVRFSPNQVLAGEVLRTGRPAMENNALGSLARYPERDVKLGYTTRSLLEVPIWSEGRIIGVLCAINKKNNRFDENDTELMTMIAGSAAISIENARFAEEVKKAYREVASMNRAKGKAINHLSHELKTPVAVLTGSLNILRKKLALLPPKTWEKTLGRIERNLDRIVDIQAEVADIMQDKTYSSQRMMIKMLEVCQDEIETVIENRIGEAEDVLDTVRAVIDEKFGPRILVHEVIDFIPLLDGCLADMKEKSRFRNLDINLAAGEDLPMIFMPVDIIKKIICGLIKNAIENTPDYGKINIHVTRSGTGLLFLVHDFGVGIEEEAQNNIFEGFFSTQETLLYSTKTPFSFNAGGKGADLLRMKIFSERLGFSLNMESVRCRHLAGNPEAVCPGDIKKCTFVKDVNDCYTSGHSEFFVHFPGTENRSDDHKKNKKSL